MKIFTKSAALLIAIAAVAACKTQTTLQEKLTVNDKKIDGIIAQMSLEEKVEMLHSKTIMSSEGVPRLGIQDIKYADGPFAVREELGDGFRPLGWDNDYGTYYPTGSALAATWSGDLAYAYGNALGTEARRRGKDIILGPAMNIQRLPVGGRTYEYFSEDPALNAILAVGFTLGMQDAGTAACLKHYALNNQETNRGTVDVIIDERPMREIYLKAFEAAVKEGGAMAVMPAYNKVNGYYGSENNHLNNEILRGEWGFRGMTVSDWGGTHSTMGAALGGLDVQMTGDNYFGPALIDSVRAGRLPESVVDDKVREILRLRFAIEPISDEQANSVTISQKEQQQVAYQVATKSIVLLKNEAALPIDIAKVKKIAVVGLNAVATTAAGGVGAGAKTPYEITPLQGLQNRVGADAEIIYAQGYKNFRGRMGRGNYVETDPAYAATIDEAPDATLLAEALAAARAADIVLFFAGTNKTIETEGSDRRDIMLPVSQDAILTELVAVNPNVVTVIVSGGPCDLRVVNEKSKAIVQAWWNGLEGGHALADVLLGKIAPSGKLPFTFPIKLEDSPAYALGNFPQEVVTDGDVFATQYRRDIEGQNAFRERVSPKAYYSEGLLVGYRWFDTKGAPVMYPFGYGLSYVDFEYAGIRTDKGSYKPGETIRIDFELTNKGAMEADEVAQLYVRRIDAKVEWPAKELKAFSRVTLAAGETKTVSLEVPVAELRYWDEATNGWQLENGRIEVLVGGSSADMPLMTAVEI